VGWWCVMVGARWGWMERTMWEGEKWAERVFGWLSGLWKMRC
jgi:hypothetical protein